MRFRLGGLCARLLLWACMVLPSAAQLGVTTELLAIAHDYTHLNFTVLFQRAVVTRPQLGTFELEGCEFRSNLTAAVNPSIKDRQWTGTVRPDRR
jgi:hypothetical protein